MTERQRFNIAEMKQSLFEEANYRCAVCRQNPTTQLAHRIPQTKANLKKYGAKTIHHRHNLVAVCGLNCNSKVNIGNNPVAIERLLKKIRGAVS